MSGSDTDALFNTVLGTVRTYLPSENTDVLSKAYAFSKTAHEKQLRAGGDPYITHPLAVARILAELHLDIATLAAGLLHDVLEDTTVTVDILKETFGPEITSLVEGVTKIDNLENLKAEHAPETETRSGTVLTQQAENWRKMLMATAHDVRVILLKLADRKHNMETLEFLNEEKRRRISEETLNLYAPIAQRLGMYHLKSTLEDLAFRHLHPDVHETLSRKMAERKTASDEFLKSAQRKIEAILSQQTAPYRVLARPKNLYSIYRKMLRQNKPFEEIQDLFGIRVVTDSVEHCYALIGAVHAHFAPVADSFTDYIAIPKSNLYQSLHTTVQLSKDEIIEIQVRTEDMHRIAEYGVAAHWRYKLGGGKKGPTGSINDTFEDKLDWLKQILEWQQETKNPKDFLEGLKVELEFDQVFVFTPKGEVKKLPQGSTPVDFAYAIHSDLGNQCVGAKVNDKMARLDSALKSGDRCEILTRKGQHPHKDWLEFVKTPRAKSRIRKFFRELGT